ncbi:glycosyltransferase family 4 protein [Candidatus Omnitrophota bacterium]
MKIAIIAPPWIAVPPEKYGGIETVVWNLVEGLTELKHDVILFARPESNVSCKLFPYFKSHTYFGMDSSEEFKLIVRELSLKYAFAHARYEKVDIIHDHTLFNYNSDVPILRTIYSAATEGAVSQASKLCKNPNNHLIAASNKQKDLYQTMDPNIEFMDVVPHAINVDGIEWGKDKDNFFLCVGRASWQKGLDTVLRVASRARVNLVMAIKMVDNEEKDFFSKEIQPLIDQYPRDLQLQLYGEILRPNILDLYKRAKCTLFTAQWEQPFGIVMIESMACGTPVIAYRRGAASEIIIDGKTGFVVNTEDEMVEAIKKIDQIDPQDCRDHVLKNYSRLGMAKKYISNYEKVLSMRSPVKRRRGK